MLPMIKAELIPRSALSYLTFNLLKAHDRLNALELVIACMSIDATSAAISITFSMKEILASPTLILSCVSIQFFAHLAFFWGSIKFHISRSDSCCYKVRWWGIFDSCQGISFAFWLYCFLRCLNWLHTAWLGLFYVGFYYQAANAEMSDEEDYENSPVETLGFSEAGTRYEDTDRLISRRIWNLTAAVKAFYKILCVGKQLNVGKNVYNLTSATTFSKYMEWIGTIVVSMVGTERALGNYGLKRTNRWDEWGQIAVLAAAIGLFTHWCLIIISMFRTSSVRRRWTVLAQSSVIAPTEPGWMKSLAKCHRWVCFGWLLQIIHNHPFGRLPTRPLDQLRLHKRQERDQFIPPWFDERLQRSPLELGKDLILAAQNNDINGVLYFLNSNANRCVIDESGRTALIWAVINEREDIVKVLLNKVAPTDFHTQDYSGETALHIASRLGNQQVVNMLLTSKIIDVNSRNLFGQTALTVAAINNKTDTVQTLLHGGADINTVNSTDRATVLLKMATDGQDHIMKSLIHARGAALNARDWPLDAALIEASTAGHEKAVELLIHNGANINTKDSEGYTALIKASIAGHIKVVEVLIHNGGNVDAKNSEGYTALIEASIAGHVNVVEVLIHNGTNVDAKGRKGRTALMEASIAGHVNVTKTLIQNGADLEVMDIDRETSLIKAFIRKDKEVADALMHTGASVKSKSDGKRTALAWAACHDEPNVIETLVRNGANIEAKYESEGTALLLATKSGSSSAVRKLLDLGADVYAQNKRFHTARDIARAHNHVQIVHILSEVA